MKPVTIVTQLLAMDAVIYVLQNLVSLVQEHLQLVHQHVLIVKWLQMKDVMMEPMTESVVLLDVLDLQSGIHVPEITRLYVINYVEMD